MVGYGDIDSLCFNDTVSAYQTVRQDGELHLILCEMISLGLAIPLPRINRLQFFFLVISFWRLAAINTIPNFHFSLLVLKINADKKLRHNRHVIVMFKVCDI